MTSTSCSATRRCSTPIWRQLPDSASFAHYRPGCSRSAHRRLYGHMDRGDAGGFARVPYSGIMARFWELPEPGHSTAYYAACGFHKSSALSVLMCEWRPFSEASAAGSADSCTRVLCATSLMLPFTLQYTEKHEQAAVIQQTPG